MALSGKEFYSFNQATLYKIWGEGEEGGGEGRRGVRRKNGEGGRGRENVKT